MTKRLYKDNPERQKRDLEIVALRLLGKSLREIGEETGLAHSRVKAILDQGDIKPIFDKHMENIREQSLNAIQQIVDSYMKKQIEVWASNPAKLWADLNKRYSRMIAREERREYMGY